MAVYRMPTPYQRYPASTQSYPSDGTGLVYVTNANDELALIAQGAVQMTRTTPANIRVAIIGDSLTANNKNPAANPTRKTAKGYINWAMYLSRQRFIHHFEDNFGVSGDDTADVLRRLPAALMASAAGTFVVAVGTNDRTSDYDLAVTVANLTAIRDMILAAGRICVFIPPRPRGSATFPANILSATRLALHQATRNWLLTQRATAGCYVVDSWTVAAKVASTTGEVKDTYTYDGLHWAQTGAYYEGLALAGLFGLGTAPGLFPYVNVLPTCNADQFAAGTNPSGGLVPNPMMLGTAGTGVTGTGSGQNADSWGATSLTGLTRVYSKVVDAAGKEWLQIVLGNTGGGPTPAYDSRILTQTPAPGNLAIGDKVYGLCDLQVDAGAANIWTLALRLQNSDTGILRDDMDVSTDAAITGANTLYPSVAHAGVMRTPDFILDSTNLRFGISVQGPAGLPSATLRVGCLHLRKVV